MVIYSDFYDGIIWGLLSDVNYECEILTGNSHIKKMVIESIKRVCYNQKDRRRGQGKPDHTCGGRI